MENDSPNLFDSEPMSVNLSTTDPANSYDVFTETIEEITENDKPLDPNVSLDTDNEKDQNTITEYQTDESDDENEDPTEDQLMNPDQSVDQLTGEQGEDSSKSKTKDVHKGLPPGRVKLIMKMDPDVNIVAGDAVFLLTKATESFVGLLAQHCHQAMVASNKKTLKKKHIDAVIEENVPFEFLEGALDW